MFDNIGAKTEKISDKLYNIYYKNIGFSFIELHLFGSPVIMDEVLSLGCSNCKNILFIGSVGSLNKNINIGDIVVPKYSITGDGATRYLNNDLRDEFGKKQYPDKELTDKLILLLENESSTFKYHYVPNFSVDTIFGQFYHLDKIKSLGAETIEMETSAFFKASNIANLKATALFVVSDNVIVNKSLYSGRNEQEKKYRHDVRHNIVPKIIINLFRQKYANKSLWQ